MKEGFLIRRIPSHNWTSARTEGGRTVEIQLKLGPLGYVI